MRVPVCGRFYPNEGGVAGYGNRIRVKYTAKWGLQIAKMIFQTRSNALRLYPLSFTKSVASSVSYRHSSISLFIRSRSSSKKAAFLG
ncbi:DUF6783 domain-containing protein [Blautia faecicola]|uniref:DUF6783 domain-containing protein n=1 Tax=Blautia faecicola TaxID=2509240 RepID=UPI002FE51D53